LSKKKEMQDKFGEFFDSESFEKEHRNLAELAENTEFMACP
jgi:hypothetical protein